MWRSDLPQAEKDKISNFILTYGTDKSKGDVAHEKAVLAALQWAPFKVSDNDQLLPIRVMELTKQIAKIDSDTTLSDADIAAHMNRRIGLPVHVGNDANLGALAEWTFGAGRGVDDLIYIMLSDGVGAGLILDGRSYQGATGTAGELGHIAVVDGEVLQSDGTRFADKARAAGVDVTLRVVPDSVHVFTLFPFLPEAQDTLEDAARWARGWLPSGVRTGLAA